MELHETNKNNSMDRLYALNDLRASLFDPEYSPRQHDYYVRLNAFYRERGCTSIEEATEMIKGTPFYDGLTKAKLMDDTALREKAMREVGYTEAAQIHSERLEKLDRQGIVYAYTQEWLDDFQRVDRKVNSYNAVKELFGRVYNGYIDLIGNPQKAHRDTAEKQIREGLQAFQQKQMDFFRIAALPAMKKVTGLSAGGYERFLTVIRRIAEGHSFTDEDVSRTAEEQRRIGAWARQNAGKLRDAGRSEVWGRADCVAVPSDTPGGYVFTDMREARI